MTVTDDGFPIAWLAPSDTEIAWEWDDMHWPTALSALAGDYTSPELGVVLALRVESGHLTATLADNHVELQRLFGDTYVGGSLVVRFKRENGAVKSLTTSDGRTNHVVVVEDAELLRQRDPFQPLRETQYRHRRVQVDSRREREPHGPPQRRQNLGHRYRPPR